MAINDATMTTETAADGTEYVAEMHSVVTETETDGTETVADITTTADPDDPSIGVERVVLVRFASRSGVP